MVLTFLIHLRVQTVFGIQWLGMPHLTAQKENRSNHKVISLSLHVRNSLFYRITKDITYFHPSSSSHVCKRTHVVLTVTINNPFQTLLVLVNCTYN